MAPRLIEFLSDISVANSPKNCVRFLNEILYRIPLRRHVPREGGYACADRRQLRYMIVTRRFRSGRSWRAFFDGSIFANESLSTRRGDDPEELERSDHAVPAL